jgi:hypothetical protein
MTTNSRLAIAPAVAFALSCAVVLALGQLIVQFSTDNAAEPTPPTAAPPADRIESPQPPFTPQNPGATPAVPTQPAAPNSGAAPSNGSGGTAAGSPTNGTGDAVVGLIEFDGKKYGFGPVGRGTTTFTDGQITAQAVPLDDEDVQVCVAIPPGATIPDKDWEPQADGRWCVVEESGLHVRFAMERAQ